MSAPDPTALPNIPTTWPAALQQVQPAAPKKSTGKPPSRGKVKEVFEAMLHKPKEGEQDGSGRLTLLARCGVERNVPDDVFLKLVRRYGKVHPFPRKWSDNEILQRVRSAETRTERGSARPQLRKLDDIGNGQRFADQHNLRSRYSHKWNKWLIWKGGRWLLDEMGYADRLAKRTARSILDELKLTEDQKIREAMLKWAKASASRDKVAATLKMAQSEPEQVIDYRLLDTHPWLFNCKNGTVDLRTGKLCAHRREDYLTVRCDLDYPTDDQYRSPVLWLAFLDRIFAGKAELIAFIKRLMGYSLVGKVCEHVLPIFHGEGANGKTVLTETWLGLMGLEYGFPTTKEFLIRSRNERHPTEMAALYGKRLVVSSETDEGARLDEARVKSLTGGNQITARRMREDFWTFTPSHLLLLETNYRPVIVGTEHAIWRRVLLVPFGVQIPEAEQDKNLATKLKAEWPMILRWAVEGCQEWNEKKGLCAPEIVTAASEEYRNSSDLFEEFLSERCTLNPTKTVRANAIYKQYTGWMKTRGQVPQSMTRIGPRMASKFEKGRDADGVFYKGVVLNWEDTDAQFENVTSDSE